MTTRSKFDVPHEYECRYCEGTGHSYRDYPTVDYGNHVTLKQGSGCADCLGTGRVEPKQ